MTQVWPVIHLRDKHVALRNAEIAHGCGCPGVLLIQMMGRDEIIDEAAAYIRKVLPHLKIGANRLSSSAIDSMNHNVAMGLDATWCDGGDWKTIKVPANHLFFAPVAFKGSTYNDANPEQAAKFAALNSFIPTTSGPTTGAEAPLEKIARLRSALHPKSPLAMSGITFANVPTLRTMVTHFLVATSISSDFYNFDKRKLNTLVEMSA